MHAEITKAHHIWKPFENYGQLYYKILKSLSNYVNTILIILFHSLKLVPSLIIHF